MDYGLDYGEDYGLDYGSHTSFMAVGRLATQVFQISAKDLPMPKFRHIICRARSVLVMPGRGGGGGGAHPGGGR